MAYSFNKVTIRTDNSESGMTKINELWADILQGKIPLEFIENGKPVAGLLPVAEYGGYESDENGKYNLSVMSVSADFFAQMEDKVADGLYVKVDECGDTIAECAEQAWSNIYRLTQSGKIRRAYTVDYESTVPAIYSKDGKAHCCLYIAVK